MPGSIVDLSNLGYLGLRHVPEELRAWDYLSQGRPKGLDEVDPFNVALAVRIATLQGFEGTLFATSTFKFFWDFFNLLSDEEVVIFLEKVTYPVARWAIERATGQAVSVFSFFHQSPEFLDSFLSKNLVNQR